MNAFTRSLLWLCLLTGAGLAAWAAAPAEAGAQEPPAVLHACYVPGSGVVYRIREPGLKQDCSSKKHVMFSWNAEGPPGPVGPAGPGGPAGPPGPPGGADGLCNLELRIRTALASFELSPECALPPGGIVVSQAVYFTATGLARLGGTAPPQAELALFGDSTCTDATFAGLFRFEADAVGSFFAEVVVPENLRGLILSLIQSGPMSLGEITPAGVGECSGPFQIQVVQ